MMRCGEEVFERNPKSEKSNGALKSLAQGQVEAVPRVLPCGYDRALDW